jgi:hypothetical protein
MNSRMVWSIVIIVACIVGYFYTQNVIILTKLYDILPMPELIARLFAALGPFVIMWEIAAYGNSKDKQAS